ncbi:MAG: outer membrane protein transport protein [Pseudomonadota bacterium]
MTLRSRLPLAAVTTLFGAFGLQGVAHAQAFYLEAQSARGAGRAFSGEAADTGPDSLWWNPASIAGQTDVSIVASASAIFPTGTVADKGTLIVRPGQPAAPVGGSAIARNPIDRGVLPTGAIAIPLNDRIALGLTLTSPYSFTTDYDANSWTRYSADKTRLRTYDIQPSIAIAPTDWLRLGAGLNVEYTEATLTNALPNVLATLPDGSQSLKGNGWDVGWSVGAQFHNDTTTIGLSYKSSIKHHLTGDLVVSGLVGPLAASNISLSNVQATFNTPWQAIAGVRVRATKRLTLNAQAEAYGWSKFDFIRLGTPVNTAIPEDYRDSWSLAGGFDYDLTPKLTVRAGVQRVMTPTRNGQRDARVPDSNRWNLTTGGTYRLSPHFAIDAAAGYVAFADASIDRTTAAYAGTAAQTPILVSGELQNAHAVVLSLGGRVTF